MFSYDIINTYWIKDDWSKTIPNLGDTRMSKVMMNIHFVGGIFCMILFPVQKIIALIGFVKNPIVMYGFHIPVGMLLFLFGMVTAVCGITYVGIHGTIGGTFMDVNFVIYGYVVFIASFAGFVVSMIFAVVRGSKFFHGSVVNIYGVLIFSSFFYRVLYTYAKIIGYDIPTNSTPSGYVRPLDESFQVLFYGVPLLGVIIYIILGLKHKRIKSDSMELRESDYIYKKIQIGFEFILSLFILITIILVFIF